MKINFKIIAEYLSKKLKDDDFLFEMANLRPKTSGLPMVIWVSEKVAAHGPRLKVQIHYGDKIKKGEWTSITIENNPKIIGPPLPSKDFNLIKQYIKLNKNTLLKYWNQEIDISDLLNLLQKL